MEIFKELNGYEGCYEISNHGRIKCLVRKGVPKEIFKSLRIHPNHGYIDVQLRKDNKVKTLKLHRLVAINFLPNPNDLPVVNHKDGNKTNNKVDNLEWVTHKENILHAHKMGLVDLSKGNNHYNTKIKDEEIPKIFKMKKDGLKNYEIAKIYNVNPTTISKILKGKRSLKIL